MLNQQKSSAIASTYSTDEKCNDWNVCQSIWLLSECKHPKRHSGGLVCRIIARFEWERKRVKSARRSVPKRRVKANGRTHQVSERERAPVAPQPLFELMKMEKKRTRRVARKSESRGLWDASDVRLGIINFIYRAKTRPPKFLRLAEYIKPTGGCLSAMTSAYFPL